jgi:hypothetical protein
MIAIIVQPLSLSDEELAVRHQLFPSDIKEMQNQKHYTIFAEFGTMLRSLFATIENVSVGGDQAFYWNDNDDRFCIAPDAHLIRGIDNTPRSSFKLWEEKAAAPDFSIRFVLELWSKGNPMRERYEKYDTYAMLGAAEYFEFDTKSDDLVGHRLNDNGRYEIISPSNNGRIYSKELDAEIVYEDGLLRLYRNGKRVLTITEAETELQAQRLELQAKEAEIEQLKKLLEARKP